MRTTASTNASSGTITLTSSSPALTLTTSPVDDGYYKLSRSEAVLAGGEVLSISASGADVPAFSTSLTAPLALTIDSPAADAIGVIRAPTRSDLVIGFSRGTANVNLLALSLGSAGPAATKTAVCSVPSEAGTLTIPAGVLATLGPGSQFELVSLAVINIDAGDWRIAASYQTAAVWPDLSQAVWIELQ